MIDTIMIPKKLSNLNKKLPKKRSNSLGVFKTQKKKEEKISDELIMN